jgi:hypothetical protein
MFDNLYICSIVFEENFFTHMLFNSLHLKHTTELDRELCDKSAELMLNARENARKYGRKYNFDFNCHSVTLALASMVPELICKHGYMLGIKKDDPRNGESNLTLLAVTNHSWLQTPHGSIIDAYPVGVMACTPVLVITKGYQGYCGGELYVECQETIVSCITREIYRRSRFLTQLMQKSN